MHALGHRIYYRRYEFDIEYADGIRPTERARGAPNILSRGTGIGHATI